MTTLIPVPTENVGEVLTLVEPLIDRGVQIGCGRTTRDEIVDTLERGVAQLWIVWSGRADAIVITSITEYPEFKACIIDLCVGENRKKWMHHLDEIEAHARKIGCDRMEIPFARPGWARGLPEYKKKRIFLEKKL